MSSEKGSYDDMSHEATEGYNSQSYRDRPYSAASSRDGYRDSYRSRGRGGYRGRGNDYYSGGGSYGNRYDPYYSYGSRRGSYGSSYNNFRTNYRSENYNDYGDSTPTEERGYDDEESSSQYQGSYSSYRGNHWNSKYRDSYSGRGSYGYRGRGSSYYQSGGYNSRGSSYEKDINSKIITKEPSGSPISRHRSSHSKEPVLKSFSNPWINILQIKDEGVQNILEQRHKDLEEVDKKLHELQHSYFSLKNSLKKLETQTAREELHVQLAEEKLEEVAFL